MRHQRTEESAERTARRPIGSGAVGNGGSKGSPSMRLIFAESDLGDSVEIAAMETKSQEGIERLVRTNGQQAGQPLRGVERIFEPMLAEASKRGEAA